MSAKTEDIINGFVDAIRETDKPAPYDTTATVRRIEDGVAWVHIPGGVDETPVTLTIAAAVGDSVQVRVANGRAFLVGNATAPPTDDTTALVARTLAKDASQTAETAQQNAREARASAGAAYRIAADTNQYFWHVATGADTGAHITEIPREDFEADPSNGGGNLLARSNGIAVRDGLTELATFSANGIQLGADGVVEISPTGATPVPVQASYDYPYTIDLSTGSQVQVDLSEAPFFSQIPNGTRFVLVATSSGGENLPAFYKGSASDTMLGVLYFLYDGDTTITIDPQGTLPAWATTSVRVFTSYTTEGAYFAIGKRSGAVGRFSGTFGEGLIASGDDQVAIGTYNEEDPTKAIIVGNGSLVGNTESRSNAFTVGKDGKVECSDNSGNLKSIFDIFYPVGSYYETSDTAFDPATAWGGTWELEAAGQVHVSAGTGYTVAGALTNTTDGGEKEHTLTVNEMPAHSHIRNRNSGYDNNFATGSGRTIPTNNSVGNQGNIRTADTGGGQAHNNMPPYIVVNRWHRTA